MSIRHDYEQWTAWITVPGQRDQVEIKSDVDFEDCLVKARDFMRRGPEWEVLSVFRKSTPVCRIKAVGVDDYTDTVEGATLEDALAKGRAECERRNAERATK